MARLIYSAITSLDGFIEDETGRFDWAEPDEEVHAFVNDLERLVGTHLYRRRMYARGTTSAGRLGSGQWEVIFTQNVTECTYLATAGPQAGGSVASFSRLRPPASGQRQRRLREHEQLGRRACRPHAPLAVIC